MGSPVPGLALAPPPSEPPTGSPAGGQSVNAALGAREAPRAARSARPRGLLAQENKGAAPRASPIGWSWSSERRSQSGGGTAPGMARPVSQSGGGARPACPGTGGAGEPSAQVAPGWQFALTLTTKSRYLFPSPPSESLRIRAGGACGRTDRAVGPAPGPLVPRCLHPAAGWRRPRGSRGPLSPRRCGPQLSPPPHSP